MTWLWWAVTGLSGAAIGVLIVMFIFAHAAFLLVVQAIAKGFMWFFRTRIGFGVVVGAVTWYGTSWYQHHVDTAEFERQTAAFKSAQKERDVGIAKDTEAFVRKQIADEFIAQQDADHEVAQFKADIRAANPSRKCPVGADAPGLRKLWKFGRPSSSDHKGVR